MTNYLNQVRHFYVAKACRNSTDAGHYSQVKNSTDYYSSIAKSVAAGVSDAVGDIRVGKTADGKEIYFESVGANGLITRSDAIPLDNILYANAKKATELSDTRKHVNLFLDSAINSGNPIDNQDYILNIEINNYVTPSERSTLVKWGAVHAANSMTPSAFWNAMAKSIVRNLARDVEPMLKVYVTTSASAPYANKTAVTDPNAADVSSVVGIIIESVDQDWKLGTFEQTPVYFTVSGASVVSAGVEVDPWLFKDDSNHEITTNVGVPFDASSKQYTANYNAKKTADLEWFAMKARADLYGMVGYPNYVPTEYLVNPSETYGYHVITIHYAYVGSNESVQKSERDITIACPAEGATTYTVVNAVITAINNVAGTTVLSTLS